MNNEARAYKVIAALAERLETDVSFLMDQLESMLCPELDKDEMHLVNAGKRVQAVKAYYNRTGCGLLEAKAAVDRVLEPDSPGDYNATPTQEELAAAGRSKIEAIKQYRMRVNCSLREAKDAIEDAVNNAREYDPSHEPSALEVEIAHDGNKIGAIKKLRERTGLGLVEAKEAIENVMAQRIR